MKVYIGYVNGTWTAYDTTTGAIVTTAMSYGQLKWECERKGYVIAGVRRG